jgi:hypothetical protein
MSDVIQKYRAKAGAILLVLLTGYAVLNLLIQSIRLYAELPADDPVSLHEVRIGQIKGSLPSSGAVGYLSSMENEKIFAFEKSFRNVEYLAQYVLTQYTLAPLIVRNTPKSALVVGNFLDGPPPEGLIEKNSLTPLRDFGEGLLLYQPRTTGP